MTNANVDTPLDESVKPDDQATVLNDKPAAPPVVEKDPVAPAKKEDEEDDDDGRDIVSIPDKTGPSVADA